MRVELRCSSCQGSGTNRISSVDYMGCLKCHGTGRVTEYINTHKSGGSVAVSASGISPAALAIKIDTRTDEEKKIDFENSIAFFFSLSLGVLVVAPIVMEGEMAWWVPAIIGNVLSFATYRGLIGPFRIVPIFIRKLIVLIGTLLAYTMISFCVAGFVYVVFKMIQEAN